jgi:ferritin-like metal-binding protein YciE
MDKMKDLKDLLKHEVLDLCSAEDQIIEGMPAMIEKATHPLLKKALREHLRVTEGQRKRLDKVKSLLGEVTSESDSSGGKVGAFFFTLFGGGEQKCKAMEGIIGEGNKMMGENMNVEVMDAAIISCAQKIEHYEICGYGTAKAFARELQLQDVATLLNETLNEEYEADNVLTAMAVSGGINEQAEKAEGDTPGKSGSGVKKAASKVSSAKANKAASAKTSGGAKSTEGASSKAASNKSSSPKSSLGVRSSESAKVAPSKSSSPKGTAGRRLSPTVKTKGGSSSTSRSSASSSSGKKGSAKSSGVVNKGGGKAASTGTSARGGVLGTSRSSGAKAGSKASGSGNKKSAQGGKKSAGAKAGRPRRR